MIRARGALRAAAFVLGFPLLAAAKVREHAPHPAPAAGSHPTVRPSRPGPVSLTDRKTPTERPGAPLAMRVAKTEEPSVLLAMLESAAPVHDADPEPGTTRKSRRGKDAKARPVRPLPPNATWRAYRRAPWRRGYVTLTGHGKQWAGYLVGADGEVLPRARQALSSELASWRTGKQVLIDDRLIGLIADVSDEFGGRPIRVVSGYRETSYAPDSKHKVGQAFDFSVPGVPNDLLRDFLRSLPDVGVGYYPNSTHVHLDVRDKPCYWVDYSRPGQAPLYSYDRRVAAMSSAERALASALDVLIHRTFGGHVAPSHGAAEVPTTAGADAGARSRKTDPDPDEEVEPTEAAEPATGDAGSARSDAP